MNKDYLVLGIAITFNSLANILIKIGMNKVGGIKITNIQSIVEKFFLNWVVLLGVFFFGLTLIAYSYVLSKLNLSIAYPIMTSLGFVLVILVSIIYLGEKITLLQLGGIVLIILGVWIVAK